MRSYRVKDLRIIGIAGTENGIGCTHLAYCLANYARSREKKRVALIGFEEGGLEELLTEEAEIRNGNLMIERNGICIYPEILPAALRSLTRALSEERKPPDIIILDLPKGGGLQPLLSQTTKQVVLGSLSPWSIRNYRTFMKESISYHGSAWKGMYFTRSATGEKRKAFQKEFGIRLHDLSYMSGPDAVARKDFDLLAGILEN